jgi:hypothetical protein
MTETEGLRLVTNIVAAWPRPPLGDETIEIYLEHLIRLDYATTARAVARLLRTAKFLPTIAEIYEAEARERMGGLGVLTPEEAWAVVQDAFRKVGSYRPFPGDTVGGEFLKRAVDMIGWETLCLSDNPIADRAHFFRVYEAVITRQREHVQHGTAIPDLRVQRPTEVSSARDIVKAIVKSPVRAVTKDDTE